MAAEVPRLVMSLETLEALAKLLGDVVTGGQITEHFERAGILDRSGQSTKWRRLAWAFEERQTEDGDASVALRAVQSFLSPVSFVKEPQRFHATRRDVNVVLRFAGVEYLDNGGFKRIPAAETVDDAAGRSRAIQNKFSGRNIHPEVWKYCTAELMANDYFHAVLEAAKGLAYRIREMSGSDGDGAELVDRAFAGENPTLRFNALRTKTEWSEHRGFTALLKGCFAAIRNPLAHEPRIHWEGEENAADFLSLISLLHRKLDDCQRSPDP